MNKRLRAVAVALGLTTICMAWLIEPLVEPTHKVIYHWAGPASVLFGPAAVELLAVWALLALLMLSTQKPGWWRTAVWLGVLLYMPWVAFRTLYLLWSPHWVPPALAAVVLVAWSLLVVIVAVAKRFEALIEFSSTVLMFVAISGVLFLTEFGWFWWQARALNDPRPLHQEQTVTADRNPKPRILWIVLDELSYQQVYERRYPGLQLPAFDALAAQAMVFTHVVPAGIRTDRVLPALLTGEQVGDIRSSGSGELLVHDPAPGKWQQFEQHKTVFQDALDDGYGTAIAGSFNPYCRMMPTVLDRCSWAAGYVFENGMAPSGTVRSNLHGSLAVLLNVLVGEGEVDARLSRWLRVPDRYERQQAFDISDYQDLFAAADEVLRDRSAGFALLHLPIPHPPGIYNRATGQITTGPSTYIDNLALADMYLAHVRNLLEQSGQWDSSTIVIMGDHGWRTELIWRHLPTWTAEEERASDGGKFDDRPAYIVKLAGQHVGARVEEPFRAVETRALLDALMQGKIRTADELQAWVRQNAQTVRVASAGRGDGAISP